MKSYDGLKAEMEGIQRQMVDSTENRRANPIKEIKHLCKEFGFTAVIFKDALAESRKKQ
ncbi:hypothetical protein OAH74_05120 [Amylibacter sp.]|nr:hypothetical protein [Amylibacter sp.]